MDLESEDLEEAPQEWLGQSAQVQGADGDVAQQIIVGQIRLPTVEVGEVSLESGALGAHLGKSDLDVAEEIGVGDVAVGVAVLEGAQQAGASPFVVGQVLLDLGGALLVCAVLAGFGAGEQRVEVFVAVGVKDPGREELVDRFQELVLADVDTGGVIVRAVGAAGLAGVVAGGAADLAPHAASAWGTEDVGA